MKGCDGDLMPASHADPEIQELCKGIIASQAAEIKQMKAKLSALGG